MYVSTDPRTCATAPPLPYGSTMARPLPAAALSNDDIAPVTARLSKFDLEAALAEMDRDEADATLNVSPDEHRRLMSEAFAGMPSPLGDEPPPPTLRAPTFRADTLSDLDYDLELEDELDDPSVSGVRRSYATPPSRWSSPNVIVVTVWSVALAAAAGTAWLFSAW